MIVYTPSMYSQYAARNHRRLRSAPSERAVLRNSRSPAMNALPMRTCGGWRSLTHHRRGSENNAHQIPTRTNVSRIAADGLSRPKVVGLASRMTLTVNSSAPPR